MFSQNKNYLSKFLQLTGILSVFILIFFSHNKVFGMTGDGEKTPSIQEQILKIKNKDQQKDDIKGQADALLQEISNFETAIQNIFTTAIIEELKKLLKDVDCDSLLTEISNKLAINTILQDDKQILEDMQQSVTKIKEQKQNYLNDVSVLSKAGEKTLEEVKTAFNNIMGQNQLLETNMKGLENQQTKLTAANKLSDTNISNLRKKINNFLNKSPSSKLEVKKTQLTKIETDYQNLNKAETSKTSDQKTAETTDKNSNKGSETANEDIKKGAETPKTAAKTTKSTTKTDDKEKNINTFQIIIIGVFIAIMISVIIVWILQQIKKPQSKR
uniref:Immunodominant protein n=1 Tax=Candidatus Phytoplasma pruni -related phytoplasma TaxID=2213004 RepID=A0A3S9VMK8_9MOLU|nr:immunodominant protein [Candidatus Phytoplasma pruni -related phytoplasma]